MKIDVFSHFIPGKFKAALLKKSKISTSSLEGWLEQNPALTDTEIRLRRIDRYPEMLEVLVPALAPLQDYVSSIDALDFAKLNNDETAELVEKYPDKFMAAVALLPLNDIDAALKETERACMGLGMRGVVVNTTINGEPLDLPKFKPLYARMAEYDLPIWIHPPYLLAIQTSPQTVRTPSAKNIPEPPEHFKRVITEAIQWPTDISLAMLRLAMSGIFEEYPKIKFITHHCGGLIPFCGDRIKLRDDDLHKFYGDTALLNTVGPLICGYSFFGSDHLLFGTDATTGRPHHSVTWDTIRAIEQLDIPADDKDKIFERNASRLLRTGL